MAGGTPYIFKLLPLFDEGKLFLPGDLGKLAAFGLFGLARLSKELEERSSIDLRDFELCSMF